MAHHKASLKDIKQSAVRNERNRYFRSTMRTAIKKMRSLVEEKKMDEARAALPRTCSVIDKCVTKGIVHRNAAARYKSRLAALLQA